MTTRARTSEAYRRSRDAAENALTVLVPSADKRRDLARRYAANAVRGRLDASDGAVDALADHDALQWEKLTLEKVRAMYERWEQQCPGLVVSSDFHDYVTVYIPDTDAARGAARRILAEFMSWPSTPPRVQGVSADFPLEARVPKDWKKP